MKWQPIRSEVLLSCLESRIFLRGIISQPIVNSYFCFDEKSSPASWTASFFASENLQTLFKRSWEGNEATTSPQRLTDPKQSSCKPSLWPHVYRTPYSRISWWRMLLVYGQKTWRGCAWYCSSLVLLILFPACRDPSSENWLISQLQHKVKWFITGIWVEQLTIKGEAMKATKCFR